MTKPNKNIYVGGGGGGGGGEGSMCKNSGWGGELKYVTVSVYSVHEFCINCTSEKTTVAYF